jgi:hypothetical protein
MEKVADVPAAEFGSLGREMARGYLELVAWYRDEMQLAVEDADAKARSLHDREWAHRAVTQPPDQVSWGGLSALMEHHPEEGWAAWERIKTAARDELASGHRVARVLECNGSPWERAQFLVIRAAFREEWQPRGGIEGALVDQMALAHACYLEWMSRLHVQVNGENIQAAQRRKIGVSPEALRLTVAEALDHAAAMADRFHRQFLRALRGLRDLRRYTPTVVVANAGQVNVSAGPQLNLGAQQVNIAEGASASDTPPSAKQHGG